MKAALLSVSDKSGLAEFSRCLHNAGFKLLSTSGTKQHLIDNQIPVVPIEEYTGQKEILDGRVKTLHPKIHAGILAKAGNEKHFQQLAEDSIWPIDILVVNLYPFQQGLKDTSKTFAEMVELIDIGGPTMIRAAAKNFGRVCVVSDPADYARVAAELNATGKVSEALRLELAAKVFTFTAQYDLAIAKYLSAKGEREEIGSVVEGVVLQKQQDLRYGENPGQKAGFYRRAFSEGPSWKQLGGKELSYNNLLDLDAALQLTRLLDENLVKSESTDENSCVSVIIKHLNPCGVAIANTLIESVVKAKMCDPRSHFGGILGFNVEVDAEVASSIREDFCEIVVAPAYSEDALQLLRTNKNLRIIQAPMKCGQDRGRVEMRYVDGGVLIQESDPGPSAIGEASLMSKTAPNTQQLRDLQLAWSVCSHVKSNAIVIAKDGMIVGVGAGQMSRIDSVELALHKARTHKHDLSGAVVASDAFFPFPDSVETLAEAGVAAIIAPSGAKRDEDSVKAADKSQIALLFVSDRHFRH